MSGIVFFIVVIAIVCASRRKKPRPTPPPRPQTADTAPTAESPVRETIAVDSSSERGTGIDDVEPFHEGEDPCHDNMEAVVSPEAPEEIETPESAIDAQELVKAVVMSEILNRRRRR